MADNTDYTKDYLKIDSFFTDIFKTDVNKMTFNNINRYLTKADTISISGNIGHKSAGPIINKKIDDRIQENDVHRQAYQLQPLFYSKSASETHITSFVDILNKCKLLGIDIENFDEWGDCDQFNFAPPIDMDKFANYSSYYWVDNSDPDYITIKNQKYALGSKILNVSGNTSAWQTKLTDFNNKVNAMMRPKTWDRSVIDHKYMWIDTNNWVHKNDLKDANGQNLYRYAKQAKIPIIEYFDDIDINQWVYIKHNWAYRKDRVSDWIPVDFEPTDKELSTRYPIIDISDANNTVTIKGDLVPFFAIGTMFYIAESNNNNGLYKVTNCTSDKTNTTISVDTDIKADSKITFNMLYTPNEYIGSTGDFYGVIVPVKSTSQNDKWLGFFNHWMLLSVDDPIYIDDQVPNLQQSSFVYTVKDYGFDVLEYEGDPTTGTIYYGFDGQCTYEFDVSYIPDSDDLQVYINGVRQYGTYDESISTHNESFGVDPYDMSKFDANSNPYRLSKKGIDFLNPLTSGDTVLIKVGPAAQSDVNKHGIFVRRPSTSNNPLIEYRNLAQYRLHEPVKYGLNQYIKFNIYDVHGKHYTANNILKFKEDPTADIHPILKLRVPTYNDNYIIENQLYDNKLLCYKEDGVLNTVWRKCDDHYYPQKVNKHRIPKNQSYSIGKNTRTSDDPVFWEIPDPLKYNINHRCDNEILYSSLKSHFTGIINHQAIPYRAQDIISYQGGHIKEHNGGFDIFVSSIHQNIINFETVINFGYKSYAKNLNDLRNKTINTIIKNLKQKCSIESIVNDTYNDFITNIDLNLTFGDATSFNSNGVPNFIATLPILGLYKAHEPIILKDNKTYKIRHHDGHYTDVSITDYESEKIMSSDYYTNQSQGSIYYDGSKFYINDINGAGGWIEFKPEDIIAKVLYLVETKLFKMSSDIKPGFKSLISDIFANNSLSFMNDIMKSFVSYSKEEYDLSNTNDYVASNPFTWNYLNIQDISGINSNVNPTFKFPSRWNEIYEKLYNTTYPNLEPWKLQGFTTKPVEWDAIYSNSGQWTKQMWDDIKAGTISSKIISVTKPTNVPTYKLISVNDTGTTRGGYNINDLLPPYIAISGLSQNSLISGNINSSLAANAFKRNYAFGQQGPLERKWRESGIYPYHLILSIYRTQPIKTLYQTFGFDMLNINGLEIDARTEKVPNHADTIFHGNINE